MIAESEGLSFAVMLPARVRGSVASPACGDTLDCLEIFILNFPSTGWHPAVECYSGNLEFIAGIMRKIRR
jgi:hypothetical protein